MPHPKIGKARTRFCVAAYIALQIAGAKVREPKIDIVILSEVRRQPNAVEGPRVSGDRCRPRQFSTQTASHILKSNASSSKNYAVKAVLADFATPSRPSRLKAFP